MTTRGSCRRRRVRDEATLKLRAVYALSQPVADCAPDVADRLRGRGVCATYRRRWTASENVIRELVGGGNLNENYGYEVQEVPNRLRQHQQQDAQAQVTTTEKQLATAQRQRETLTAQSAEREQALAEHLAELTTVRTEREAEGTARRQAGQATRRVEQQLAHLARETQTRRARHARRTDQFERQTRALAVRQAELETKLVERRAVLAAIRLRVTEPMFERDLEKDQLTPALAAQVQVWPTFRPRCSMPTVGVVTSTSRGSGVISSWRPRRRASTDNGAGWSTARSELT